MAEITLVVNVFGCKEAVLFPEAKNKWPREELIKVLQLSGVAVENLPRHSQHEELVNLFLERLNVQNPVVYALVYGREDVDHVLLNSQTVEVKGDEVHLGPMAGLHRIDQHHSRQQCDVLWSIFERYNRNHLKGFVVSDGSQATQYHQMLRIKQLEKEVSELKSDLKKSRTAKLKRQFDEANALLKMYKARMVEEKERLQETYDKNLALIREVEQLKSEVKIHEQALQKLRDTLGNNWNSKLQTLIRAKQDLSSCREKLARASENLYSQS